MSEEKLSPRTVEAVGMFYDAFNAPFKIVVYVLNSIWDVIKIKKPEDGVDITIGVSKTDVHPKP